MGTGLWKPLDESGVINLVVTYLEEAHAVTGKSTLTAGHLDSRLDIAWPAGRAGMAATARSRYVARRVGETNGAIADAVLALGQYAELLGKTEQEVALQEQAWNQAVSLYGGTDDPRLDAHLTQIQQRISAQNTQTHNEFVVAARSIALRFGTDTGTLQGIPPLVTPETGAEVVEVDTLAVSYLAIEYGRAATLLKTADNHLVAATDGAPQEPAVEAAYDTMIAAARHRVGADAAELTGMSAGLPVAVGGYTTSDAGAAEDFTRAAGGPHR